jgi:hypothetical protein
LVASVFPVLVVVYLFYWVSGPRYFFEGLSAVMILGAGGVAWLAGWLPGQEKEKSSLLRKNFRQGVVLTALAGLVLLAAISYTPARLHEIKDRYGFSQRTLEPFNTSEAQELTPALIIVHAAAWWDYGVYLNLQDPHLKSPFIFAWASPAGDPSTKLSQHYPDRAIYHYYPDQPGVFYRQPLH